MTQPAPRKKDADQPCAEPVVVAVAEIPVAAVEVVGHQRCGKVQELHKRQPCRSGDQIDAQRFLQVHILGPQPDQRRQKKPLVAAVPCGKGRIRQHRADQHLLQPRLILGQQHDLARQQQHGAAGQPQPRQTAEPRQRSLNIGAENLAQHQQQRQPCAVDPRGHRLIFMIKHR